MNIQLKQFLLSLINATLILGIVFLLLGFAVLNKAESFAANVISDVKVGLLEEVDKDVRSVLGSIRKSEQDLRNIAGRLQHLVVQPEISLSPEIEADIRSIDTRLAQLQRGIAGLFSSHETLSDHAIREIAATMADTYIKIRKCGQRAASPAHSE